MKKEPKVFDPYPPKPKWEAQWVDWNEEYLDRIERFKNQIRPPKMPETARLLGGKLRRAREAQGISIEQAAQSTCIQVKFLGAIEYGALESLPGGLYTRRFIESYARFLNFDLRVVSKALVASSTTAELLKDSFSRAVNYNLGSASAKSDTETKLPRLGELLLYCFLSEEERDGFLGDVEQVYVAIEVKFGIKAAKIFFYKEIINSMSPLLARFIARIILAFLDEMR